MEALSPVQYLLRALGIPAAVRASNAHRFARVRLHRLALGLGLDEGDHSESDSICDGSLANQAIDRVVSALTRGALDEALCQAGDEKSTRKAVQQIWLPDAEMWHSGQRSNATALSLAAIEALVRFATERPDIEILLP